MRSLNIGSTFVALPRNAWKRERKGGSKARPSKGGHGEAKAKTRKCRCTGVTNPNPLLKMTPLDQTAVEFFSVKKSPKKNIWNCCISFVFFGLIICTELWFLFSFNHPQSILIFEILQIQCEAITILSYLYIIIICHTWFDNVSFLCIYKLPILVMWCCLITVSPTAVSKDLTVHRSFDRFIATRFHQKTAILQRHFSVLEPQDSPCGIELKGRLHWTLMTPVCWVCFDPTGSWPGVALWTRKPRSEIVGVFAHVHLWRFPTRGTGCSRLGAHFVQLARGHPQWTAEGASHGKVQYLHSDSSQVSKISNLPCSAALTGAESEKATLLPGRISRRLETA